MVCVFSRGGETILITFYLCVRVYVCVYVCVCVCVCVCVYTSLSVISYLLKKYAQAEVTVLGGEYLESTDFVANGAAGFQLLGKICQLNIACISYIYLPD